MQVDAYLDSLLLQESHRYPIGHIGQLDAEKFLQASKLSFFQTKKTLTST